MENSSKKPLLNLNLSLDSDEEVDERVTIDRWERLERNEVDVETMLEEENEF